MTSVNAIDRYYLVQQEDGALYPTCITIHVKFAWRIPPEQFKRAFEEMANGGYGLLYELDLQTRQWQPVTNRQVAFEQMFEIATAEEIPENGQEAWVSEQISTNTPPLPYPLKITVESNWLHIKMHHSFGDGRYLIAITQALISLAKIENPSEVIEEVPHSPAVKIAPLLRRSPKIMAATALGWLRSIPAQLGYGGTSSRSLWQGRSPVREGTPMRVHFAKIPKDTIQAWRKQSGKINFNTLLQAHFGLALHKLGFAPTPITYTIPVDLRLYLPSPHAFQHGNFATQIKVTRPETTMEALLPALHADIQRKFQQVAPLHGLPSEWLLRLAGHETYDKLNREWQEASTTTDPRVFVLSNLGIMDRIFDTNMVTALHGAIPLMGSPPLTISFGILGHVGQITLTADPTIFSVDDIQNLLTEVQCAG